MESHRHFPYGEERFFYASDTTLTGFFRRQRRTVSESIYHLWHNHSFNPFAEFISQNPSLSAWLMRTTAREKCLNILSIFLGSSILLSQRHGFKIDFSRKPDEKSRFGLVDYIPGFFILKFIRLCIYKLLFFVGDKPSGYFNLFTGILTGIFAFLCVIAMLSLTLPSIVLAGICAALCFPIAYIAHRKYADGAQELKNLLAANDKVNVELFFDKDPDKRQDVDCEIYDCKTKLRVHYSHGENYAAYIYRYEESTAKQSWKYTSLKYSDISNEFNTYEVVAERFVMINNRRTKVIFLAAEGDHEKVDRKCLLFSDTTVGRAAFEAFKQLNIANYEKFKKEKPQLDDEESDSKVKASACTVQLKQLARIAEILGVFDIGYKQIAEPRPSCNILPKDVIPLIATRVIAQEADNSVELPAEEITGVANRWGFVGT